MGTKRTQNHGKNVACVFSMCGIVTNRIFNNDKNIAYTSVDVETWMRNPDVGF